MPVQAFNKLNHMKKSINWPSRIKNYPKTLERFRATCIFFDVKFPPFLVENMDSKAWVSWGALTALASIPEIFTIEIETLGYYEAWKKSPERLFLRQHWLLATLKELRNYDTHLGFAKRRRVNEMQGVSTDSTLSHKAFFFSKVSFSDLSHLNNVKSGKSYMNEEGIAQFNEIVEENTVEDIVDMALDVLSEQIYIFSSKVQLQNDHYTGGGR